MVIFCQGGSALALDNSKNNFPDIKGHWAEKIITEWTAQGLIAGLPDGTFAPNNRITRAEFVTLVNRAFKEKVTEKQSPIVFVDVEKKDWFYNEVMCAAKAGYIKGFPDGRFGAKELITRQDVSVIINRFLASPVENYVNELKVFTDSSTVSDYAINSVAALKKLKIISGYPDGTFGPQRQISRAEAVAILERAYKILRGDTEVSMEKKTIELKDYSLIELSALNKGEPPEIYKNEQTGIPRFIGGKYTPLLVKSPEEAIRSLNSIKTLMKIGQPEKEFICKQKDSILGVTTYRLQQVYNGVPVYEGELVISTDVNGVTTSLMGDYLPDVCSVGVETTPQLSREEAIAIAKQELGEDVESYASELMIYTKNYRLSPCLVWLVSVSGTNEEGLVDSVVFVDARKGKVLDRENKLKSFFSSSVSVNTSGRCLKGETKSFVVEKRKDTKYVMHDLNRKIWLYSAGFNNSLPGTLIESTDNTWSNSAAIDAYTNLAIVYDYYKNVLGRNSFDNRGMDIICTVDYREEPDTIYDNAFWNPHFKQLAFGEGRDKPQCAALDLVGHEFTHGVVYYTAGLRYQNQSGALDEAYADILGNLIENKADPEWLMGEDCLNKGAIRSGANPNEYFLPDKVGSPYYREPVLDPIIDNDYGWVHTNSAIIVKAAHLMWENVLNDKEKLAQLWYVSLFKLKRDSDFVACRLAVIQAAKELKDRLGLTDQQIISIAEAFDHVGICAVAQSELDEAAWYYPSLLKAMSREIISGYPDGEIYPMMGLTKAEFLTALFKTYGYKANPLTDVDKDFMNYPVKWRFHKDFGVLRVAKDKGWIDDSFQPDLQITREEAGYYLWEACKGAKEAVKSNLKLVTYGRGADVKSKAWQAKKVFSDQNRINPKYEEAIYQLYMNNIYTGYVDRTFRPTQFLDKATCSWLLMRTFNNDYTSAAI